jgi:hypothetical protein
MWRSQYGINSRGKQLATWEKGMFRAGGVLTIGQHTYQVKSAMWTNTHTLLDPGGGTMAVAERVGRKHWTITSGGQVFQFRRASLWRADQELLMGGKVAGVIRHTSSWRFGAEAELDPLPLPLQMFAIAVVLHLWEQAAAAAG